MKPLRTGRLTAGITLTGVGLLLLLQTIWGVPALEWIRKGWPLVLIFLGLELLMRFASGKVEKIKMDGVGLAVMAVVLLGTIFYSTMDVTGIYQSRESGEPSEIDKTFTLPDSVETVVIDANSANMKVKGTNRGNRVNINGAHSPSSKAEQDLKFRVEDDKAVIRIRKKGGWDWWRFTRTPQELTLDLPPGKNLELKLTNGNLHVEKLDESVRLRHTNGNLTIQDLTGNVRVNHTNGNLDLRSIRGVLEVNNVNGNIRAAATEIGGDWHLRTVLGNVQVHLPPQADVSVEGKTTLGETKGSLFYSGKDATPRSETRFIRLTTVLGDLVADTR